MPEREKTIEFDPGKVRLDLSLGDAFALTSVRSPEEFLILKERLTEIRGQSYLFINILDEKARLIMTVIRAEEQEIIATYELDPEPLGIALEELILAGEGSGNHPLPNELARKIKRALGSPGRQSLHEDIRKKEGSAPNP